METGDGKNYIEGNDGNDWIFGSQGKDYLFGDASEQTDSDTVLDEFDLSGGDDIIFTGVTTMGQGGDYVHGGYGDDRIYGEGYGDDFLYGELGDDLIDGGPGDDMIWGDDFRAADSGAENTGLMWGHDTLYGGDGEDYVRGGHGDDYIFGGTGDDNLYGH